MTESVQEREPASSTLCKACGLCCTGHLFTHASFKPAEVETIRALGLQVLQSNPDKPIFLQPCSLWDRHCTIYTHPDKPSVCKAFKCLLLEGVEAQQLPLVEALRVVEDTKRLIRELDAQIPEGQEASFHKRLVKYVNQLQRATTHTEAENTFRLRAGVLLVSFARRFGVNDLFDKPEQEMSAQG